MKIIALAGGGVGGAKLADGLAQIMPPQDLTVIINTGDDFEHFGLPFDRFDIQLSSLIMMAQHGRPGSNAVLSIVVSPLPGVIGA